MSRHHQLVNDNRYYQLVNELKEEHGLLQAKRLAKKKRIIELLEKLSSDWSTSDEKFIAIKLILILMNEDE